MLKNVKHAVNSNAWMTATIWERHTGTTRKLDSHCSHQKRNVAIIVDNYEL